MSTSDLDKKYIELAIEQARESVNQGGFPAGAIVVKGDVIIGRGISIGNRRNDPTSHGEMEAIRDACKNINASDLSGATLYASMQPCIMCFGATMWSSIGRVAFACSKEKVSDEYYGGHYKIADINQQLNRSIKIEHLKEFEEESLKVVREWEKSFDAN
jgi:guanine deaminase